MNFSRINEEMESQETDDTQVGRKVPIEKLSKEDLVKKYRQAILIAQKAKESKTELMKHLSQHEELIQSLQEKLLKVESERKIEADLRGQIENQLKKATEAMEVSQRVNSETKQAEITKYEVDSRALLELEDANTTIQAQESELVTLRNDLENLSEAKNLLNETLGEKENEMKVLKKTMDEEKALMEQCISELRKKINTCEKSLEDANRDQSGQILEKEHQIVSLRELLLGKDKEVERLEESLKAMDVCLNNFQKDLSVKQSALDNSQDRISQLSLQLNELQGNEGQSTKDTIKDLTERNNQLSLQVAVGDQNIRSKDDCINQLSQELEDTVKEIEQLRKSSSESVSMLALLQSDKEGHSQQITCLEFEKEELKNKLKESLENLKQEEDSSSDLKVRIEQLENELEVKQCLLDVNQKTVLQHEKKIQELNLILQDQASGETNDKAELQCEIVKKDEEIYEKGVAISELSSKLAQVEEDLQFHKQKVSECFSELDALKAESAYYSQQLHEKEHQIVELSDQLTKTKSELEGSKKEASQLRANYLSASQEEQELKDKLSTVQELLQSKDSLLQDLEQEVLRLKEAAAMESTNTEVSSTFSLSRAEEQSRLRDLEDSFEDKYTKLRVVAVKLKRRVTELSQTLESERSKMAAERSDIQAKITHSASQAKVVQTLQTEVDRLQDLLEDQKKSQKQLKKDLDSAVREVAETKSELDSLQEKLLLIKNEKKSWETTKCSLEFSLSKAEALASETDRLCKEINDKDLMIETLRDEKKKIAEQLEKVNLDAKKKSVLSLEIADMEKSVSELNRQLTVERDNLKKTEKELEEEHSHSLSLQQKLKKSEEHLQEKDIALQQLKELFALSKEECLSHQKRCEEKETTIEQLSSQLEKQRTLVEELNVQCSDLASKLMQTKENARLQVEALSRQLFQVEEQHSSLRDSHKALEDELATVRSDFENYKVRAQSVLRQSAKQEERAVSSSTVHDAEELELEVERLRVNVNNLKANLNQATSQLQTALQEVTAEREEKAHLIKLSQSSKESCAQAIERQHAAEERLSVVLDEAKQAKLQSETLIQCYKMQLEDLKNSHQKKITSLTEQIENLQASVNNSNSGPVEGDQVSSLHSGRSPVSEWAVNLPNPIHIDQELSLRLSTLQREEGEGSESVDSFPSRRISVTTQDRGHELVPLDKLLSSSAYPEHDVEDVVRTNSSDLNINMLQSKLSACESRVAHLTALLSEAESDAARLSQLNAVLKEEIRRQQRSDERAQHAHNLEYLKNIVVKFITLQNGDERQRLVPVLNTILKLSPEEEGLVASAAKGTPQANSGSRGWGSYLPLPGWTGS